MNRWRWIDITIAKRTIIEKISSGKDLAKLTMRWKFFQIGIEMQKKEKKMSAGGKEIRLESALLLPKLGHLGFKLWEWESYLAD